MISIIDRMEAELNERLAFTQALHALKKRVEAEKQTVESKWLTNQIDALLAWIKAQPFTEG